MVVVGKSIDAELVSYPAEPRSTVPMWNPPTQVGDEPVNCNVSSPEPPATTDHCNVIDCVDDAFDHPLHSVVSSIGCDHANVTPSPVCTLPTVPLPLLLVNEIHTGAIAGVDTVLAPRCFDVRVIPDAHAAPVMSRTAPANAHTVVVRRVMGRSPTRTRP